MLATKYNPTEVESKWYQYWLEKGFFNAKPPDGSEPGKEPFTIVIPPPNVTGVLHMGHMLNNTIQDVLIRRARMQGKEALWVPGTDHASIATEAKVVAMLREKGIKKSSLSRDEFLKYAWEWKEKYGGIILEQLKKLGASCDWNRTAFTMDPAYYKAVIKVFVDLYNKGYVYRDYRMVNWDCEAKTTISNEEVMYKEEGEKSVLYSLRYKIKGSADKWITIATQRPETILGDTAIAVNPNDDRYKHLVGKQALVPFINRAITIIADDYVDMTFGTGCLKVTPAHDVNDYEIGLRHKLDIIDTISDDGSLNEKCEWPKFIGKDRFWVRKEIVKDLRETGHLVKEEEFTTRIGRSERTNTVVEPKLSLQWFIKMKEISVRAKEAVENDDIKLHPAKFKNTYRHWMENVRDWCISRQLWWGHRIPAWYDEQGNFVVAESEEEAYKLYQEKFAVGSKQSAGVTLTQDADVLDTWASSWLWPIEVFHGFDDQYFDKASGKIATRNSQPETRNSKTRNPELDYFYPTQVLVTAPEILFFWVARMIIAGYEYMGEKPFEDVYLTGIVRDKLGRKMSKSLGNSPDPLELIEKYGADGVRTGMLFSSPAGNDLPFDERLCEQGRNFANKIWNAFRLIKGWTPEVLPVPDENKVAAEWFESKLNASIAELNDHYSKFRISDALLTTYKLVWDDFCAWYLEMIKPEFGKPIDATTYNKSIEFFEKLLKLLHPFMPFITEELWHELKERSEQDCIIVSSWPSAGSVNSSIIKESEFAFATVSEIRNVRNAKNISPKEKLNLQVKGLTQSPAKDFWSVIKKLSNLELVSNTDAQPSGATGLLVDSTEMFIPMNGLVDTSKEREAIQKEIEYLEGFKASVDKKLGNEKFVNNAKPEIVEIERRKKADAEAKLIALREALKNLGQ